MTILKTLAVGTFLASTLVAGSAFAKAHEQGVGKNGEFTDVGDDLAPGSGVDATVEFSPANENAARPDPKGRPEGAGNVPTPPAHGYGHDEE